MWFDNNITHLRKLKPFMKSESEPYLSDVIYRNQLEYISALKEGRQYKRALAYFDNLERIPFSIRKKYLKRVAGLFLRTLTRK
jgi:hypothetical protein